MSTMLIGKDVTNPAERVAILRLENQVCTHEKRAITNFRFDSNIEDTNSAFAEDAKAKVEA